MMRVKVAKIEEGLHPSEVVVSLETRTGEVSVVVDSSTIENGSVGVGWPVGKDEDDNFLVELPRESLDGSSRVWVSADNMLET